MGPDLEIEVESYSECSCGAITVYYTDGANNSLLKENLGFFGITLPDDKLADTFNCNHCVNHYGLDLCACGSGESPSACKEGFEDCGHAYERKGQSVKFKGWVK